MGYTISEVPLSNVKALMDGITHCYIGNHHSVLYSIRGTSYFDKVTFLKQSFSSDKKAYLVVSKKSRIQNPSQVLNQLNAALLAMEKYGTIESINAKYLSGL